jgi:hypothetical protein
MTFHRPGAFACNFGLAVDNNLYYGGWSFGAGNQYLIYTTRLGGMVTSTRLAFAADYTHAYNAGMVEPYGGAVISGSTGWNSAGTYALAFRYRYLQILVQPNNAWYTVNFA